MKGTNKKKYLALMLSGSLLLSNGLTALADEGEETESSSGVTEMAPEKEVESTPAEDAKTETPADASDAPADEPQQDNADGDIPMTLPLFPDEIEPEEGEKSDEEPGEGETKEEEPGESGEPSEGEDNEDGETTGDSEETDPGETGDDENTEPGEGLVTLPADPEDMITEILPIEGLDDFLNGGSSDETEEEAPELEVPDEDEETIEIATYEDLLLIGSDEEHPLDASYELTADIYGGKVFAPIGTVDEPFTGTFYGNGHVIAALTIDDETAGFFGSLTGSVYDLTLTAFEVEGTTAGILAGVLDNATVKNVMVTGTVTYADEESTIGAVAGVSNDTDLTGVTYFTGTNLPAVGEGDGTGTLMLRSQPPYIAIVKTQVAQLGASEEIGPFQFSHYSYEMGFTLDDTESPEALLTPEKLGRFTLTVTYVCEIDGEVIELPINIPVIISEDVSGLEEMSTVNGVFYEQLKDYEVVQISALEPLQLLEGVFAEELIVENQYAVTTTEDVPTNKITTWEQFKNIGNTDYDPDYTMHAIYLLDADIVSDGEPFTPIGTEENPFYGEFDGRTFSFDLAANPEIDTEAEYCGLFGVVKPPEEDPNWQKGTESEDEINPVETSKPTEEVADPEETPETTDEDNAPAETPEGAPEQETETEVKTDPVTDLPATLPETETEPTDGGDGDGE